MTALATSPVFESLRPDERARLVAYAREHVAEPGEYLCRADAPAATLWCLVAGSVRIDLPGAPSRVVTSGLFGEEAAIGMEHYLTDVVAEDECRLLALPAATVQRVLEDDRIRHDGSVALYREVLEGWASRQLPAQEEAVASARRPAWIQAIGWTLAVVLPALVLRSGAGWGLEWGQLHFLVVSTAAGVLWVTGLVPPVVAVLLPLTVSLLLGIVAPPVMLQGFGSRVFFMVLSIYGIAIPLLTSGVITRGVLRLLAALPATPRWRDAGLFFAGALLTPVIPSPERRVRLLAPLAADLHAAGDARRPSTPLLASTVMGTTLLTPIFLSSSPMSFVIFGLMAEQMQVEMPWLRWAAAASVVAAVLVAGQWALAQWFFPGRRGTGELGSPAHQLERLGPMRLAEWIALVGALVFMVATAVPALHQVDPRLVALTIFSAYVMVRVVSHQEINVEIDWSFLLFLGAFLGIAATARYIQVDRELLDLVPQLRTFMRANPYVFVLGVAGVASVAQLFVPAAPALIGFLAMTLAHVNGMNAWVIGFVVLVASDFGLLGRRSPWYRTIEQLSREDATFDGRRFLRYAFALWVLRIAAIGASLPFWTQREML